MTEIKKLPWNEQKDAPTRPDNGRDRAVAVSGGGHGFHDH